jgi:integrase
MLDFVNPLRPCRRLFTLDRLGRHDEACREMALQHRSICPVKAVRRWLDASGIFEGALFRPVAKGGRIGRQRLTDKSVCDLVKHYAKCLGLDAGAFGAHSLRSGFLTSAARRGASVFKMRDVSRHKSMDVLQAYVRDAELFRDHAGAGLL